MWSIANSTAETSATVPRKRVAVERLVASVASSHRISDAAAPRQPGAQYTVPPLAFHHVSPSSGSAICPAE